MLHQLLFTTFAWLSLAVSTSMLFLPMSILALDNSATPVLPFNESSQLSSVRPPNNSASSPFIYEMLSTDASILSSDFLASADANPVYNADKSRQLHRGLEKIFANTHPLRLSQKGLGPYDVQLPHRQTSCECCQSYAISLGVVHLSRI